jgi:CheY-like chemotaxis protein
MSELLLQQQGLCIDTASSGEQAMDMLAKRDYDLLLIDVHLPGLSGCARHHAQRRTRAHHRSAPLRTAAHRSAAAAHRSAPQRGGGAPQRWCWGRSERSPRRMPPRECVLISRGCRPR